MPYIAHGTLREQLARGPLTLEDAGVLLEQIASALDYAHEQGIIHRDIKPSNILMRDDHYAYLEHFGLAKPLDGGSTVTQMGILLGTPEYMAPELAKGPVTVSSDLYALGILLYQMVTGQLPFSGETPIACYLKQLQEFPTPPSHVNPAVPPAIEVSFCGHWIKRHSVAIRQRTNWSRPISMPSRFITSLQKRKYCSLTTCSQ